VAKLNPTGSALVYSSYMGGGGYGLSDAGIAIKVDGAGYAYLTGITETSTDLFTGASFPIVNAFQPERGSSNYDDAFVAKLTPQGALVYSSYLGGIYTDEGHGIAVGASGDVYVTGVTNSEDFPIIPGAFQPQISGGGCSYTFQCPDAFVTRIADGHILTVTKQGTGSGTVTSAPDGINCGADCSESYANGTIVTLTATPAAGSSFAGWSGDADCADGSVTLTAAKTCTAAFSLLPALTLTAPNGGEVWPIGSTQTIRWSSSGITGVVTIELSRNGGTTWTPLVANTANDGSQSWVVTGPATTQARIRVKSVLDAGAIDTSDSNVTLGGGSITVQAPDGGESWPIGSTQTIRWSSSGLTGNVKIELSRNGGVSWGLLIGSTANDGVENWVVSGPATSQARLRVSSVLDAGATDTSNGNFTLH
jgi:hypothetical protein